MYELTADSCRNDMTPRCPSPEVRLRVSFEDDLPPGKETPAFDVAAEGSRLNEICAACEEFEPRKG